MMKYGKNFSFQDFLMNCHGHIATTAKVNKVKRGEIILSQGEPAPHFCILLEGNLKSYHTGHLGNTYLVLIHNPGDIIGEIEIMHNRPCICTVEALKDSTLLCLPKDLYLQCLQADIEFNMYIHRKLCDKVYLMAKKRAEDILYPLKYRLLNLTKYLVGENESGNQYVRLSKEALVEELGVTLRSINRAISALKEKNILCYVNGCLEVISNELLEEELKRF